MATKIITIFSLLTITINVQSQFYDFFQGYQPFIPLHQTTKRPDLIFYQDENNQKNPRGETVVANERQTSKEQGRKPYSQERESNRRTTRKKHTTTVSIFNLNFFTTPKPKKVNKSSNRRHFDTDINPQSNENIRNNQHINSGLLFGNDKYYDDNLNNIAGDYRTTTKRSYTTSTTTKRSYGTTKPSYATARSSYTTARPSYTTARPSYTTARPSYATARPSYATARPSYTPGRPSYATAKPSYANPNVYNDRPYDLNAFSTIRPGVKPANVDLSKPPITNKPTKLAVYPKPTDSSVIRFPEDPDVSPEVIKGPDEDQMSYAEKRRYIELVEKMCDKYKALSVKRVEAIPLLPSPEPVGVNVSVCPRSTVPLVVGGRVVTIQEYPHMALLGWTKVQGGGYSWKCGGSLISDQYVLTASHCAYQDKDDTVVTGAPRVVQLGSSYLDDTGALVMKVSSVTRHPNYVQTRSYYDIALIKLVKPVTFSEVVKPACLGQPPSVGEPVIVTGWGRTEFGGSQSLELRSASVPVWDIEDCHRVLGTSRKLPNGPSADSQICAGEKKGGKDTCQGDSGGPAQIQDGCAWRVVAVTSVGRSCGAPNTPALYATLHIPFIAAQIFGKVAQTESNSNKNNNRDTISVNNDNNDSGNIYYNSDKPNNNSNNYNRGSNNQNSQHNQENKNNNGNNYKSSQNNNRENDYNNGNNYQNSQQNNNNRETVQYNNNNNQQDYNIKPITNLDNNNNNRQDVYSIPQNYNTNNRQSNYNNDNYNNNGYNSDGNRNNNYRNDYFVQPAYTVTEAPRYDNDRPWWQPY